MNEVEQDLWLWTFRKSWEERTAAIDYHVGRANGAVAAFRAAGAGAVASDEAAFSSADMASAQAEAFRKGAASAGTDWVVLGLDAASEQA